MLTKIVILTCLAAFSSQDPHLAASLPYVANYASSYDAHVINHDVRVPVAPIAPFTAAITAYAPAAPLTSVVPQAIAGYSVAPLPAAVNSQELPARSTARSNNPTPASEEQKSAPGEPQRDQPSRVPDAVLLASQFLARNAANQRNAPNAEQNRDAPSEENQRNAAVLGATPNGFGFVQRPAAAQQRKADFRVARSQIDQRSGERAKLIRQNEDSESIEVNSSANSDSPAYGVESSAAVKPAVLPARLAAVAPSFSILPNVYTNVITF